MDARFNNLDGNIVLNVDAVEFYFSKAAEFLLENDMIQGIKSIVEQIRGISGKKLREAIIEQMDMININDRRSFSKALSELLDILINIVGPLTCDDPIEMIKDLKDGIDDFIVIFLYLFTGWQI